MYSVLYAQFFSGYNVYSEVMEFCCCTLSMTSLVFGMDVTSH